MMRLLRVERGHRLHQKLMLLIGALVMGKRSPGYMRMLLYRPELYGNRYLALAQSVMRGPSEWSVGERELFAAFTSNLNQCSFCIPAHTTIASIGLADEALVRTVLHDWRTAPISEKLRVTIGLLEKLTLRPGEVGAADLEKVRAAAVSETAIEDAVRVCLLFNITNRMADALDVDVPSIDYFRSGARMGLKWGYGLRIPRSRLA